MTKRSGIIATALLVAGALAIIVAQRLTPQAPTAPACEEGTLAVWLPGASMLTARSEATAASLDGRIYVAGGILSDWSATSTFEVYDVAADEWHSAAPLPVALHHVGLVGAAGRMYMTGGYRTIDELVNLSPQLTTAWAYDPGNDTWSEVAPMPSPRGAHIMVTLDDLIYVIGGTGPDAAEVWVYDPAADTWDRSAAPLPTLREHLTATVLDGKIFVIGGRWNRNRDVATVEVYDPAANSWAQVADLPLARAGLTAGTLDGHIHVAAGEHLAEKLTYDEHDVFDPETGLWCLSTVLPTLRHGLASAVVDGRWYVIGGATESDDRTARSITDLVDIYPGSP